jgi:hypothetical protein
MSTNRSVGRSASTQEKVRSTSTRKKDRSPNLCAFTFADGRQCRTPRCSGHLHLCYFHAQKEAESLAAQQVGKDISRFLPAKLLTACDLGAALSRTFCAVAQGQIKPKVASTLGYLAQTMLQSIPIAQHEYIESFNTNTWRNAVRFSFRYEDEANTSASQPAPTPPASSASAPTAKPASSPAPQPPVNCHSACPDLVGERSNERPTSGASPESYREEPAFSSSSAPSPTPACASSPSPICQPERSEGSHPTPTTRSAQPAPSPHTPLPPTITEFFQQVEDGRNSSRSEIPTLPEPGREIGSSGSSSSSAPSSTCSSTNQTQPTPGPQSTSPQQSPPTQNSQHNSLPAPAPPAPPPVPPGFGAPANWDVLISPKPRRRFSRHWQFRE